MSIPFIWARPVIPGKYLYKLYFFLISINSNCDGKHGLGPTKLILPFKTFQSCGNSSNLDFLSILPSFVIFELSIR